MTVDRHLTWDGCYNVRDLGGLRTATGGQTRWRSVVRADAPDGLTAAGWAALAGYGIRTIIDLRNEDERKPDIAPRPADVSTVHLPLDGVEDTEFWDYWGKGLQGTPLYYRPFLDRFPHRVGQVIAAIAHAQPGGVLVHCAIGRDRTGLLTLLLLALAGVAPEDIATDHALSTERLRPAFAAMGTPDQGPVIEELLTRENTTAREAILSTLASLDVEAYLRSAGRNDDELAAVRARLLMP